MKWLRGYIVCCVGSGRWERFMNLCRHHNIRLWDIEIEHTKVTFCMFAEDYRVLKDFVQKTNVVPHICKKQGFPFVVESAKRNWTFTFGLVLFFAVLKILSLFVWQINYYGQQEYTKETIGKVVTAMGVYPGMLRKNLNCDSIERNLRECYENMSWVSAEEKGCVLNIKIKEGTAEKHKDAMEETPQHLTAPCDGVVETIVTKEGTPKVKKGDSVKKGDVLISGIVEIKDDSGTTIRYNGVCADGEVSLTVEETYEDSINIRYMDKNKTGKEIRVYTISWNGSRFSIKNPLKWFDNSVNYDIMNNICIDKAFAPFDSQLKVMERTYIPYETCPAEYTKKQAEEILKKRFLSQIMEYEEQGVQIGKQSLEIKKEAAAYKAEGRIQMSVTRMEQNKITEEELRLPEDNRKEDDDGTGAVDS